MGSVVDASPVILRDFMIGALVLPTQLLASRPALKLEFSTEHAALRKPIGVYTESEDGIWTAKGGVKVPSTARDIKVAVSIKDDGVTTELCNATVNYVELARHAQERSNDPYEIMLDNVTSSTLLFVTCLTGVPPSQDVTTSNQNSAPISSLSFGGWNSSSSARNTAPSYQSLSSLSDPKSSSQMSPECLELERRYKEARGLPSESRARLLNAIGHGYLGMVMKKSDTVILDRAICILDEAVQCSSVFDHRRGKYLTDLSSALITRFERTSDLAALSGAIAASQGAVLITDEGDPYKAQTLNVHGVAVMTRYEQLGDLEDLEFAITQHEKAVACISDPKESTMLLNNLANALMQRFKRLGEVQNLEVAILRLQKAVDLTPDDDPNKPSQLNNLGIAFEMRFDCLGNVEDLETAISHEQLAIRLTPDGHPDKSGMLGNLGIAFETRFDRLGDIEDLQSAIRHKQLAVELTPDGHPDKPSKLENLGIAFERRFDRLDDIEDLELAIYHKQLALELIPDGHPDKPRNLSNLANALDARFSRLQKTEDIESSVFHRRTAVTLTPEGHSNRPGRLSSLANTLVRRFRKLGDTRALDEAIISHQTALDILPDAHSQKYKTLRNLATALYTRYECLQQPDDLICAHKCSSTVASLVSVPPVHRLKEARQWALSSVDLGLSPLPAYRVAIDMLPRVAWLGLPVHGQHALLEEVGEVVRDAMGAAMEAEEHELAVEWAEAGRSIAWQNFLTLRSPLDGLCSVYPELATRLQSISQQLEVVGRTRDQINEESLRHLKGIETEARSSTQLALDWDKTVEEVRTKSGFEFFLKAKSFSQLAGVARDGPVIILNIEKKGCAALLLIPEEVGSVYTTSIPLPDFSLIKSQALYWVMMEVLTTGGVRERNELVREDRKIHRVNEGHADRKSLKDILKTLWMEVVQPVIEALAYQPRTTDLPRIWWCATGPLAFLPIHAAGIYDEKFEEPGHKLSDYVVSSYIPTLSTLLDNPGPNSADISLLTVAQAEAPGASRIPNTEVEVERVNKVATNIPVTSLMKGEATIEKVLEGMEKNSWVHLACHGKQNDKQPMKSCLLLHNGRLELERLIAKPLPKADFAFLSACQTATGDDKVAEESVHLAAGMIFSGYKGVIATMWSINDSIAPQIAEDVYRYMLADGKPDRKKAAHALHYAVKRLRESKADVLTWVPFIHIGR